jgi:uncharacterized membrane protein YdjX (TVP38/TMEM64 family)
VRRHKYGLAAVAFAGFALLLWSLWDHDAVLAINRQVHPVRFFGAAALLPAIGLPLTPLFLMAGARFGVPVGLLLSLLALAANLALCYWLARSALRPRLVSVLRRFDYELPDAKHGKRNPLRFTVMMKLAPGLPAFIKHYVLGLTAVPFRVYMVVSMLITGTYAGLLIVLGDSLFDHDLDRGVVAIAVTLTLAALLWWWRRKRLRAAAEA